MDCDGLTKKLKVLSSESLDFDEFLKLNTVEAQIRKGLIIEGLAAFRVEILKEKYKEFGGLTYYPTKSSNKLASVSETLDGKNLILFSNYESLTKPYSMVSVVDKETGVVVKSIMPDIYLNNVDAQQVLKGGKLLAVIQGNTEWRYLITLDLLSPEKKQKCSIKMRAVSLPIIRAEQSKDSKYIYFGLATGKMLICESESLDFLSTSELFANTSSIIDMFEDKNGNFLFSVSKDEIKVWDKNNNFRLTETISAEKGEFKCVSPISGDNLLILDGENIEIFSREFKKLKSFKVVGADVAYESSDGNCLVVFGKSRVTVLDKQTGNIVKVCDLALARSTLELEYPHFQSKNKDTYYTSDYSGVMAWGFPEKPAKKQQRKLGLFRKYKK